MKKFQRGYTILEVFALFWVGLIIAMIIGWVLNIQKLWALVQAGSEVTTMFIVRCIGLFPPVGGIIGWF